MENGVTMRDKDGKEFYEYHHPVSGKKEMFYRKNMLLGGFFIAPIYFCSKNMWSQAAIAALIAFVTAWVGCCFYVFFIEEMMHKHFIKEGYTEITDEKDSAFIN